MAIEKEEHGGVYCHKDKCQCHKKGIIELYEKISENCIKTLQHIY